MNGAASLLLSIPVMLLLLFKVEDTFLFCFSDWDAFGAMRKGRTAPAGRRNPHWLLRSLDIEATTAFITRSSIIASSTVA